MDHGVSALRYGGIDCTRCPQVDDHRLGGGGRSRSHVDSDDLGLPFRQRLYHM
jgi:hypothetical protein